MIERVLFGAYAAASAAHLSAEGMGAARLATATKACLMPLLLSWLLVTVRRGRSSHAAPRWLAAGLVFAWFGDLLLAGHGDALFKAGIAAFLVMQVCYIVSFTRVPGPGLVRSRKITTLPYLAAWLLLNRLVSDGVGALRVPVLIYSAVLVVMAIAALDLVARVDRRMGWRIAVGAPIFVASDGLIAMTEFGPLSPSRALSVAIMATYVVAQGMIVTGLAGATRGATGGAMASPLRGD